MNVQLPELPPGWSFKFQEVTNRLDSTVARVYEILLFEGIYKISSCKIVVNLHDEPAEISARFARVLVELSNTAWNRVNPTKQFEVINAYRWAIEGK